jgi:hypothetical protein
VIVPYEVRHGDCIDIMRGMVAETVDAIVGDPPYSLSFMGKEFDTFASARHFQEWCHEWATEALRILKPGGHMLMFGGTRTYHRLVCGVEDAGFEIRDSIMWVYGSGFPKSMNVSSAIDKAAGAERTKKMAPKAGHENFVGRDNMKALREGTLAGEGGFSRPWMSDPEAVERAYWDYAPATPEAAQWEGWGTALKPGHEPIVLARKPIAGTVAANVLEYGTGALNIDGCRISTQGEVVHLPQSDPGKRSGVVGSDLGISGATTEDFQAAQAASVERTNTLGRWPANLILSHSADCVDVGTRKIPSSTNTDSPVRRTGVHAEVGGHQTIGRVQTPRVSHADEDGTETISVWRCAEDCPVAELDRQSGVRPSGSSVKGTEPSHTGASGIYGAYKRTEWDSYDDVGGASRFFYVAKASASDRTDGLTSAWFEEKGAEGAYRNTHPT